MLWVKKVWKGGQKSCAYIPCFRRPSHICLLLQLWIMFLLMKQVFSVSLTMKCDIVALTSAHVDIQLKEIPLFTCLVAPCYNCCLLLRFLTFFNFSCKVTNTDIYLYSMHFVSCDYNITVLDISIHTNTALLRCYIIIICMCR